MALTIRQLIEKLEKAEDKSKNVYFESPDDFHRVDGVYLYGKGDIALYNNMYHDVCRCEDCKKRSKEL